MITEILLIWYSTGVVAFFTGMLYLTKDVTLNTKSWMLLIINSLIGGLGGFVIFCMIVYWFWNGWASKFAIDEHGRRDFPWRKDD